MGSSKINGFLNSIGIIDTSDFDLEFGSLKKDNSRTNSFVFEIIKDTPWNLDILNYFIEKFSLVTKTEYHLIFKYKTEITESDVINLFKDYYHSIYGEIIDADFEVNDNVILYDSLDIDEKIKKIIYDFTNLLEFITYPSYSFIKMTKFPNSEVLQGFSSFDDKKTVEEIEEKEEFYDEEPVISDEEFFDEEIFEYNENEFVQEEKMFDFDAETRKMVENQSSMIIEQNRIMEENLKGLDQSKNYYDTEIKDIVRENAYIVSKGEIFSIESKEGRGGKMRYTIGVHDGMDCVYLVAQESKSLSSAAFSQLGNKKIIKFTGVTKRDKYINNDIVVNVTSFIVYDEKPLRTDASEEKRVELHLHTKMSNMDAVGSIDEYCALAKNMGHTAIAITDHGVVQGYPDAQKAADKYKLKMIYGSELYVVDDNFVGSYNPTDENLNDLTYVVFDLETTGLSMKFDKIIEFGAVKVKNGMVIDRLDLLINPGIPLPKNIIEITHITDEELRNKPSIDRVIDEIMNFIGDATLVSHNLEFDFGFLNEALIRTRNRQLESPAIDTLALSRFMNPEIFVHRLGALCRRNEVYYNEDEAHRADYDAEVLSKCWFAMCYNLVQKGYTTLKDLEFLPKEPAHIKHSFEKHVTVYAKNQEGLKDLYKLISLSHVEYLGRVPCVPRSKLVEHRKNLIVGSACFNGEVFDTASRLSDKTLNEVIKFYDFIEIQPIENYSYLINIDRGSSFDKDRLMKILTSIIHFAKQNNKLICATGDVHYVNPEDKIFRDVYIYNAGVGKTSHAMMPAKRKKAEQKGFYFENPDQYYRSTEEMLKLFSIFGEENAREWVVTNTNKIADMCEVLLPVKPQLFPPKIKDSDKILREICYKTAHELYGDELPELIVQRLEKELNGIIDNGYSVIYYIAHLIIKKTNDEGYIVGSRGSVGSSFVATMAKITEVNPLPPHYRCPKCRHFELYEGNKYFSGYDLPTKKCPICGENMIGDGQNIPFETFLGFNADKVPDIDLNFPPDYQAKAHEYTKVLLGERNVFRAGTIGTVAEKTAFGHAKGYYELRHHIDKTLIDRTIPKAKRAFLASGCKDVKRTTGQHPGGIVVIPSEFDVYDFTPIQYPADDMNADWMTTHFDFHAIHDTVLKLDLLGHVDPQALKFMCDRLGVFYQDIPLNDPEVYSLFSSPKALKLKHNYQKHKNGALAIPEFGTDFVRGLLDDTKPATFADLLIISGLSHGTNVWRGNADELIKNGTTDLRGVIGCRDDIMTYLIRQGVPSLSAFMIMEKVRKGKGINDAEEKLLKENGVPDYYIESCRRIHYLFPKAHATAYVTMAIRVGWFKVHHPLIFYAGFFSDRCDKYDWEAMYAGPKAMLKRLEELATLAREHPNEYTKKHEEIEKTLNAALEMYDRGYKFMNLDIYKSDNKNFIVDEEHKALIPPFKVVDGLGDAAAESIIVARKDGEFSSIEDFEKRTKINQTQIELFKTYGVFGDMSAKDIEQLSLFDFL